MDYDDIVRHMQQLTAEEHEAAHRPPPAHEGIILDGPYFTGYWTQPNDGSGIWGKPFPRFTVLASGSVTDCTRYWTGRLARDNAHRPDNAVTLVDLSRLVGDGQGLAHALAHDAALAAVYRMGEQAGYARARNEERHRA